MTTTNKTVTTAYIPKNVPPNPRFTDSIIHLPKTAADAVAWFGNEGRKVRVTITIEELS